MITLEQVKSDIKSGKSKRIYYSKSNLWWTHLDSDVIEARVLGKAAQEEQHKKMMAGNSIPVEEKKRYDALYNIVKGAQIPVDPLGSLLFQTDDCEKWISEAEKKPEHFGKHGLLAFMKSHHQNSRIVFDEWELYNFLIDKEL